MDYSDQKKRIAGMNYLDFNEITLVSMLRLTDVFKEPLVRCIIARAPKHQQNYLLSVIEKYYDIACQGPYPEYFNELQYDIDCKRLITADDESSAEEKPASEELTDPDAIRKRMDEVAEEYYRLKEKLGEEDEDEEEEDEDKQSLIASLNEVERENVRLKEENYNLKNDIKELHEEAASDNIKELKDKLKHIEEHYKSTLIALLKPTFLGSETDARDFLEKINGLDNEGVANVMNQFANQEKVNPNRKKRRTWEILTAAKLYSAEEQTWSHHMRKSD